MRPFPVLLLIAITLANGYSNGHISHSGHLMGNININDINNIAAATSDSSNSASSSTSSNSNSNSVSHSYTKNTFNNDSVSTFIVTPINVAPTSSPSSPSSSITSKHTTSPAGAAPSSTLPSSSASSSSAPSKEANLSDLPITSSNTSTALRDKRDTNFGLDPSEIARQNQITQQLLSTYLQTRLGLGVGVTQKVPTIAEILPQAILTPITTTTTTTTTTPKPRYTKSLKRPRPRGFSVTSGSSKRSGFSKPNYQRKTYGSSSSQRKTPNSLQELLKYRNYARTRAEKQQQNQQQQPEDEYEDEGESEPEGEEESEVDDYESNEGTEADEEEASNNKTLNFQRPPQQHPEPNDDVDDYDDYRTQYTRPRYRSHQQQQQQRYRSYHTYHRHYDDDIDQDGQEALQSVESEQHDHYYKTRGDIFARDPSENEIDSDCPHCVDDTQYMNKWTMPLLKLGEKRYYLGIFFKANWFKATQYCRYHGMHLASISSQEENDRLEKHIKDFGLGNEHFWISGTDLADEGSFFWMATGRPITFTNWNAGEPNNFRYENGEEENCMELWNRDGKGLKWNDSPCSFETYFVCEVQP
ncbi:uncharacterized protein DDB_G0290587 isoform X1 [Musca domestica]|uniref:Uncharacterized protein DDB_G0290587 isoform X1 n=1 Tax=Musca domestica TaxID=7370 RepID=A0ABM3UN30_MUSDO|nr:uncharacterized protein DDB_G0290587 isoform X1 [Musca domestica]XP_058974935.1 uncharacterized protein DDB_G0290587 isoform X1 [Musca domestica]